ncbi:HlyD family secretion protein [Leptospira inadai serovar Lyme str. 10]|uniref:HlyD family secretion protein n=2 Tax=Leptospira inadai serovar Lyme TaxID=293084 RepID=V6HBH5_9LEPT|nr:efflux RND transporter periplasmic adaptor subunit [Leptospira inadai]EQA36996.1 HlyD family secretion protein [Leptospira inadai serovar Lyme str. 10]PNV74550.1 efflux transporter periplasmic adaptor subunit [Leptospira inadai serovar Lyme]
MKIYLSEIYSQFLKRKKGILLLSLPVFAGTFVAFHAFSDNKGNEFWRKEQNRIPKISEQGRLISFPPDYPGLTRFSYITVGVGNASFSVIAPARVVASIKTSVNSGEKIILFDSPETTQLFSEYKRNRATAIKGLKDLMRVRDMYANQAATGRDVTEAESNFAVTKAEADESESKLRTIGLNPKELDNVKGPALWLICDVPESQLSEVQKGEEVRIQLSSFPGKTFVGHAEAIGDAIDPVLRTVKVRVTIKNPKEKILPGMYAKVDFGDPHTSVILLPNRSILTVDEKNYVFVKEGTGSFRRRQIILGTSGEASTIVTDGLSVGETILIEGVILLKGLSFGF